MMITVEQLREELRRWSAKMHPFNFRVPHFGALMSTTLQIELEWGHGKKMREIDRFALWDRMSSQGARIILEDDEVHVAIHLLWVDLDDSHKALRHNRSLMQSVYQRAVEVLGEKGLRYTLIYFFELYPLDRKERQEEISLLRSTYRSVPLLQYYREKGYLDETPNRLATRITKEILQENWGRLVDYVVARSNYLVAQTGLFAGSLWLRFFQQNLTHMMQHVEQWDSFDVQESKGSEQLVQEAMSQLRAFIALAYDENAKGFWPKLTPYWVRSLFDVYFVHDSYLPTDYEVMQLRSILDMYVGQHWQELYPDIAELMQHWQEGRQISSLFRFMNAVAPYVVRCVSSEVKEKVNRHWQRRRAFWMRYWRQRRVHLNRVFIPKNLWDSYSGVIREKLQRYHLNGMYKLYTERYYRIAFHFTLDGRYDLTEMMFNGKFRIYHNRFHQIYNANSFAALKYGFEEEESHHTGQWERTFDDLIQRVTHRPAP